MNVTHLKNNNAQAKLWFQNCFNADSTKTQKSTNEKVFCNQQEVRGKCEIRFTITCNLDCILGRNRKTNKTLQNGKHLKIRRFLMNRGNLQRNDKNNSAAISPIQFNLINLKVLNQFQRFWASGDFFRCWHCCFNIDKEPAWNFQIGIVLTL